MVEQIEHGRSCAVFTLLYILLFYHHVYILYSNIGTNLKLSKKKDIYIITVWNLTLGSNYF